MDSIKNLNIDNGKLTELENDLEIEKEKSRAAIEMAREEISQAEDRFRAVLSEKEQQLENSRQLHQKQQDDQDHNIGLLRAKISELEILDREQKRKIDTVNSKLELLKQQSRSSENIIARNNQAFDQQMSEKEEQISQLSNTIR